MKDIRQFQGRAEQFDDVTMLVIAYAGDEEKKETEISVPAVIGHMPEVQRFVEKILERHGIPGEDRNIRTGKDCRNRNIIFWRYNIYRMHNIFIILEKRQKGNWWNSSSGTDWTDMIWDIRLIFC